MKNIIVTGASSFIGRNLVRKLDESGNYCIFAVVRRGAGNARLFPMTGRVRVVELDMGEYSRIPELLQQPLDACVALAWNGTRGSARDDYALQEENYRHSMECLYAVCSLGCKKFLSAGSQAEYGPMHGVVTEESACLPNTAYGREKLRFYQDASKVCEKNGVCLVEPRFFSLYGEGDNPGTMVLSILDAMLKNEPCRLTACIQRWDFLHIEDAVRGLELLISGDCTQGAYNFASGKSRVLKGYIEEMYRVTQSKSRLLYGAVPYPKTGMVSMRPSVDKLQRDTGWEAAVSFGEGIRRIIDSKRKGEENAKNIGINPDI